MKLNRAERLIRIVQLLQAGRRYDVHDLATQLEVSRRTAFRDLQTLREAGLPCSFDPATESYTIDHSHYLQPLNLTLDEGLALLILTRKIINERVVPGYSSAVAAGLKIEASLPPEVRAHCGALLEGVEVTWPPTSDVESVNDVMLSFQRAVADKTKVGIRYDSFYEKCEIETVLRPYLVVFRSRGWYVIAYSERHREVRTFKLERMLQLRPLRERFKPDGTFNQSDYFGNAWNMVRGTTRYHVEIGFSKKVAGNVEEVAWHRTQRTRRRSDGSLVFEVDVDGIDEIAWWVLGYGDQAVVQEPQALRALIASHAKTLTRYYEGRQPAPFPRD